MQFKPAAIAILGSALALAAVAPAAAHPDGYGHRHRMHRHHARMLPPGIAYRDPSLDLRPRGRPDFLIHGYMPRFTELPMYNEPPGHFPQR